MLRKPHPFKKGVAFKPVLAIFEHFIQDEVKIKALRGYFLLHCEFTPNLVENTLQVDKIPAFIRTQMAVE